MPRKLLAIATLLSILAISGYFLLSSSPIDAVQWQSKPEPEGIHWRATPLVNYQVISHPLLSGAEEIIFHNGLAYTGILDGSIVRFDPTDVHNSIHAIANTGGRPLGLTFDDNNALWVADGIKGLLKITFEQDLNASEGNAQIFTIAGKHSDASVNFADDLVIDKQGVIWFTDASQRFNVTQWEYDILEMQGTGRLLSYNPKTKKTSVHLENLHFPNGITLSPSRESLLITETTAASIRQYWIGGNKAGHHEIWIPSLPGYPDNIYTDEKNRIWVAIASPRHTLLESLSDKPYLRNQIAKLPTSMRSAPHIAWFIAFNANKQILYNKSTKNSAFSHASAVTEYQDFLYLGNPIFDKIMITSIPKEK